ncbi:hypothetical protein ES703_69626 [subsurface metagenome]
MPIIPQLTPREERIIESSGEYSSGMARDTPVAMGAAINRVSDISLSYLSFIQINDSTKKND